MLISLFHGLSAKRNNPENLVSYGKLATDVRTAPIGKSSGSYVLDETSVKALETTLNLPDLSGFMKNVKFEFMLERLASSTGDFITATVHPSFPIDLGPAIIDEAYIEGIRYRKFITDNFDGPWTAWKEIGGVTKKSLVAVVDPATTKQVDIDPIAIRNYAIELNPGGTLDLKLFNKASPFFGQVNIDIQIVSSTYTINWPPEFKWVDVNGIAPPSLAAGSRLNVVVDRTEDGNIYARFFSYTA